MECVRAITLLTVSAAPALEDIVSDNKQARSVAPIQNTPRPYGRGVMYEYDSPCDQVLRKYIRPTV